MSKESESNADVNSSSGKSLTSSVLKSVKVEVKETSSTSPSGVDASRQGPASSLDGRVAVEMLPGLDFGKKQGRREMIFRNVTFEILHLAVLQIAVQIPKKGKLVGLRVTYPGSGWAF